MRSSDPAKGGHMWRPATISQSISALPLVGGFVGGSAAPAARQAAAITSRTSASVVHQRLGTYTAMTASLMPPEVIEAITYASKHYVMLDELHDPGERIAKLVRAEAAMVTSGAASALTLGTAATLTGLDRQDRRPAEPRRDERAK